MRGLELGSRVRGQKFCTDSLGRMFRAMLMGEARGNLSIRFSCFSI